jgi:hypothetical protein
VEKCVCAHVYVVPQIQVRVKLLEPFNVNGDWVSEQKLYIKKTFFSNFFYVKFRCETVST